MRGVGVGVDQLVDVLTRLESHAIRVYPRQCSKLRHRRSTCTRCADYCPVQAITWGDSLEVDPDKCTGCGICAAVCPTGALEAQAPTNGELLTHVQALAKEGGSVTFVCPKYLETGGEVNGDFVQVNCLGRLDESILVDAVAEGSQIVRLVDSACQNCSTAAGRVAAGRAVERANALLSAFGMGERISLGPQLPVSPVKAARLPAARGDLSRRTFFSLLARETARVAAVTVQGIVGPSEAQAQEGAPKKGKLPVRIPMKHRQLLESLRKLGSPIRGRLPSGDLPLAEVEFTAACTGCAMCSFFCPTGALAKEEQQGEVAITFWPSRCTACDLCEDICYRDAVEFSELKLDGILEEREELLWRGRFRSPEEQLQEAMARIFEASKREVSREP